MVRQITGSESRYYDDTLPTVQREVQWLDPDLAGLYNGKHDRLPKCDFVLRDDTPRSFFVLYHSIKSQLSATPFHLEILPDLSYNSPRLDLTESPINAADIPAVGKESGGTRMPQAYWEDEHKRLGRTLFMMLNANKVLANSNAGQDALSMHTISGDGFAVLQDILILHHPRHHLMLAPRYDDVRLTAPVMDAKTSDSELLVAFNKY
jgi:hypothetical protein